MSVETFSITTDIEDRADLIELFHNMQLINPDAGFKIIEIKNYEGEIDCCISSTQGHLRYTQLINLAGKIVAAKKHNKKVKKPTSKRTTTRMREGIKKKAAAKRRKDKKLSKKDVTWKSRKQKDPGIPASFPYKDKIIKGKKEELKLQRQQEREAALARGEANDGANGLAALLESAQQAAKEYDGEDDNDDDNMADSDEDIEYEISDVEDEKTKIFKTVVDEADVILYVLDARDPEATRSRKVEQAVLQNPGKRLILVLNKVDLIPTNALNQWLNFLKSSFPTVPVKAAPGATNSTSFNKNLTNSMTSDSLLKALKSFAAKSNLKRSIIVGVIGYPNVGKSSIINASQDRQQIEDIGLPGIVFPDEVVNSKKQSKSQQLAKLALLSAIPPKQIDTEMADGLKNYYQLPALPSNDLNEFVKHFLIHIARTKGRLGRGGVPNMESAAMSVLNDWRDGRIIGWTLPKASKSATADAVEDVDIDAPKSSLNKQQWCLVGQEFDLDGLLGDNFGLE
ncbi:Nuclear GTP-binding protein NUG1 [Candida viswanathii]|uniref:Nuclear GTP-binding protein NUG1 n=1 Tax=Candida viswanathii TaxID=5486 RepID=A0A367XRC6_9ASCO|nr:Nuclear GTP-binding protein NUG1 [Candida viswanathii]